MSEGAVWSEGRAMGKTSIEGLGSGWVLVVDGKQETSGTEGGALCDRKEEGFLFSEGVSAAPIPRPFTHSFTRTERDGQREREGGGLCSASHHWCLPLVSHTCVLRVWYVCVGRWSPWRMSPSSR